MCDVSHCRPIGTHLPYLSPYPCLLARVLASPSPPLVSSNMYVYLLKLCIVCCPAAQVVYSGRVATATEFFATLGYQPRNSSVNIADYMLDTVIRARPDQLETMVETFARCRMAAEDQAWVATLAMHPASTLPQGKFKASYWKQLKALASRRLRNTYRHPFLIMLNFLATLVMAIALGLIFRNQGSDMPGIQNRMGVIYFILLYLSLMGVSSLPVWRCAWVWPHAFTWLCFIWLCFTWFGFTWLCFTWFGFTWFGFTWFGFTWFGFTWFGFTSFGFTWFGFTWFGFTWFGSIWFGSIWLCFTCFCFTYFFTWFHLVLFHMLWFYIDSHGFVSHGFSHAFTWFCFTWFHIVLFHMGFHMVLFHMASHGFTWFCFRWLHMPSHGLAFLHMALQKLVPRNAQTLRPTDKHAIFALT
jgi:hypothetical protein